MSSEAPNIELVWQCDCPNIEAAREVLRQAADQLGIERSWVEWDVDDEATPTDRRGYGSPTILVDGVDVAGARPEAGSCCRVYTDDGTVRGTPSVDTVVGAIRSHR